MVNEAVKRLHQIVLIASVVLGSWLGMQVVHELGHVLGAFCTGGRVARVVLHPLTISQTQPADNPKPLLVVWAGPTVGVLLPLVFWVAARAVGWPGIYVLRFFAGFCLMANGAYIGVGAFARIGDAGEMLRHGSPFWLLLAFGAATVPLGLWLWHRQGAYFGLGSARGVVSKRATYWTLVAFVLLVVSELVLGGN